MAGPNYDVIRVTAFGTSCAGAEEWQTGFWIGLEDAPVAAPDGVQAAALGAMWQTFFTAGNTHILGNTATVGLKLNWWGSGEEKPDPAATIFHYYTTPIVGTQGGSMTLPPQISVVASLHATPPNGYAGKGRMYLPGCHLGLNTDGQISSTERGQLATTLATLFTQINASADVEGKVINMSPNVAGLPVRPGVNKLIGTVRIGSVYDTQRRRRNGLNEVYSATAVTP